MSYTNEELLALIDANESDTLERKQSFADKDKICKTICAFANDLANTRKAGVLWIGIEDGGKVLGVDATDDLQQKIAQIRSDGKIQPLPSLTIHKVEYQDKCLLAIVIQPSLLPPVSFDGRIWVRIATTTQLANNEDERRLSEKRRTNVGRSFDSEGIPQASLNDLNKVYFESIYLPQAVAVDVLEANGRTYEERLIATKLAIESTNPIPSIAGVLAIGVSPQDWLSGAYVQYVRYKGTEHGGEVVDERRIAGNLQDVIVETENILKATITTAVKIVEQDQELRKPDYPLAALQQLFRNAILHREYENTNTPVRVYWFDDRIEITNTGGPFGTVTAENFGSPYATDYRNPVIAEVLHNLGYVQKFGFGIQNAKTLLAKNGNPFPQFELQTNMTIVTVYRVAR
ncbi:MAG: transcriptional regulator [Brachymonas sp.]|nr:transcriptional regulator [Brachymonas sp.]